MTMVQCPVDGCDYSGPRKSVLGHYSGKSDGVHPGGYQKAKSLLETDSEPEPEPESEPDQQAEQEPANTAESTAANNPTFGSADPRREPEPDSQPSEQASQPTEQERDTDEYVCLDCGGELVDFREHERGSYAEVSNGNILVRGEWLCSDCGKWWFDE